jgi:hypothetical protein
LNQSFNAHPLQLILGQFDNDTGNFNPLSTEPDSNNIRSERELDGANDEIKIKLVTDNNFNTTVHEIAANGSETQLIPSTNVNGAFAGMGYRCLFHADMFVSPNPEAASAVDRFI